jgi:putative ATP-binding cassette transporter
LSRQILAAPLRHLEGMGIHRLLVVLADDIPTISGTVILLPGMFINIAIIVAALIYLGWLSTSVLAITLGCMLVGLLIYQIPTLKGFHYLKLAHDDGNAMIKHFRSLTAGTKELKLHRQRRKAFLAEALESTAASLRKRNIAGITLFNIGTGAGQLLAFLFIGFTLFIFPRLQEIDSRTMTGYTVTILYLMTPLQIILDNLPRLARAKVALQNMEDMGLTLASGMEEPDPAIEPDSSSYFDQLELVGVTHTYNGAQGNESFTLGPIDLVLLPGELVFIAGGNGSGKTTLAKLMTGLYTPESGEVQLNGHRVTNDNRDFYRQHFSVVFQDFHLFDGLLGLAGSRCDEQVRAYLKKLQLDHKVEIKDGVFSTIDLSQGQRKRLALLTAYIEDRPIYVFDEWAADQDPLFKDIFYFKLLPELKARGKTILVITHDDRYYGVADRIIKLEYGKVEFDKRVKYSTPETASID